MTDKQIIRLLWAAVVVIGVASVVMCTPAKGMELSSTKGHMFMATEEPDGSATITVRNGEAALLDPSYINDPYTAEHTVTVGDITVRFLLTITDNRSQTPADYVEVISVEPEGMIAFPAAYEVGEQSEVVFRIIQGNLS